MMSQNSHSAPPVNGLKIAVMQPYLFPYIGYFQLLNAVDKFIIFDDVNYINKGWVNRNRILVNNKEYLFTIPLKGASQNKLIFDIEVSTDEKWQGKFLKTIEMSYKKAPYYSEAYSIINETIYSSDHYISKLIAKSIVLICKYLGIKTEIVESSNNYHNCDLRAEERIIYICRQEQAGHYINPIGGHELYSKDQFARAGIELSFLSTNIVKYPQFDNEFIPNLSIIDVLMFNSAENIKNILSEYELV